MKRFYHQGDWTYEIDSPKEFLKYKFLQWLGGLLTIGVLILVFFIVSLIVE